MRKITDKIMRCLLPHTCVLCGLSSDIQKDLCRGCQQDLPWLSNSCKICANPLSLPANEFFCGKCKLKEIFFYRTLAAFQYQSPIDHWIISLKFHHHLQYARLLAALYTDYIKEKYMNQALPEILIPVPLHTRRLCERGFNQSLELARELKKTLHIPVDYQSCQRIRATETQSLLPAKKRWNNVKDAFTCDPHFSARHVAIVDDVMTTGETINALSKALQQHHKMQIDVWCIARASTVTNSAKYSKSI